MTQPAAALPADIQAALSDLASAPPDVSPGPAGNRVLLQGGAPASNGKPAPVVQAPTTPPAAPAQAQESTTETPGEAVAEEPAEKIVIPPEDQDKLSRAAQAAEKARASAKRNREIRSQQEFLARQQAQTEQQLRQLQAENQRAAQFQQLLRSDPYTALKQLGLTDQQIIDRGLKEGSPEAQIERIQQQLAAERQERLQLEHNLRAREYEVERQQVINELVTMASDETKYPHLADQPPQIFLATVARLNDEIKAAGGNPALYSKRDICEFVEEQLAAHKRQKALKKNGKTAPANGTNGKPPTQTLTNRLGSSKYSMPTDYDKLPEEEQMAALVAMAEGSMFKK